MINDEITEQKIPEIVRKIFPLYQKNEVKLTRLLGMTNKTYRVDAHGLKPLLFRSFVSNKDHSEQNELCKELANSGVAPQCYYSSKQFRVEQFLENTWSPSLVHLQTNKSLNELIMKQLYKFHRLDINLMKEEMNVAEKILSDARAQQIKNLKFSEKSTGSIEQFQGFKQKLMTILSQREKLRNRLLPKDKTTIRLCHNDLNNLNILVKGQLPVPEKVTLIDYDYTSYNYIAYDIANYLNQICFHYEDIEPGFNVVYEISRDDVEKVCSVYPGYYEGMKEDIGKMLALANLYWACWCLETSLHNASPTFDPLLHGKTRLQLYFFYLQEFLQDPQ